MKSMNRTEAQDDGFSLLEVIIAFTVLAISLSIGVQTISGGTGTFKKSAEISRTAIAIDELWSTKIREINNEENRSGELENGVKWRYRSTAIPGKTTVPLYVVKVLVTETDSWEKAVDFTYFVSGKP
ncbi:MAG: prepilin-type N-terminal cleavage/methylation domain-containing protein [Rhizobiaceae bacterium]|nr:prepilin-type N-terminal cleavage/methylation domain-containing protein [Rhizobiaceae bacterium]